MKKNGNNEPQFFYISSLREKLREQAVELTGQLSRSVALLTSYDDVACVEYENEIRYQQTLAEKIFYIQQCRNALEQCIAGEAYTLRYRWNNGAATVTKFLKTAPNRVKVEGLIRSEKRSVKSLKKACSA